VSQITLDKKAPFPTNPTIKTNRFNALPKPPLIPSSLVKDFLEKPFAYPLKRSLTAAYHPSTRGLNGSMLPVIAAFCRLFEPGFRRIEWIYGRRPASHKPTVAPMHISTVAYSLCVLRV
jgi:hypothetical protein